MGRLIANGKSHDLEILESLKLGFLEMDLKLIDQNHRLQYR
ncbi:hypothetical protein MICAG_970025 [Microcystis aeruginosa PCC 9808]|uniref:Uncharacterized protein n=1 Tax=Microcystis aeruginosa PCC 9808 TaxID=1160284 RepID=I4I644_MICAE|nr:hypothetical protein MICAG_970025 [Microcystis aeruginosa PCC 9808]